MRCRRQLPTRTSVKGTVLMKMMKLEIIIHPCKRSKSLDIVNEDNSDLEEDEKGINWEIERDWSTKYFRRNNKMLVKKPKGDEFRRLCNHRKAYDKEGQLLVQWNTLVRDWVDIELVTIDRKQMVEAYLKKRKISKEQMGFGLTRRLINEAKKALREVKSKTKEKLVNDKNQEVCAMVRSKFQLKK
jgi:hypothetical protein